ncbi:flagellin N-terminal helical domain-containing protein [Desulfobacter postgatei]|uniref:Flagellin n=1 Tax=Desulfobacter postgatei 2ac9 TaxID=879212 RepID=I5B5A0_9BACT|nr:flagellin [Desulfobacter postgatei]EIM64663.1 flagellin/flagellar hook associated protein [Desulfobacter postgatei 2ac9]
MALRINTNVAALNAHKNLVKNDNNLSSALEKLSSGLRINKAADDASGMSIADSLKSQSLGLGQAIRNGNDAISIVQTADAALEESINIVNTIKTKSIQAAQDGQTTDSRKAIQADITKLREELDNIAKTTSFNNQKLLSGNFTDKKFQIGAYAGETVDISIQSTEANKIGHITTSDLTFAGEGTTQLNVYSNLQDKTYSLNSIELAYDNSAEHGVGAVADAINKLSDVLGISATASVSSSTDDNITAGTTDSSFSINGVTIGALDVKENDSDGALVSAINNKTSEHGVTASVDQDGVLTLNSTDNRAIKVTMGAATQAVMGGTEELSTLGTIEVRQEGTSQIAITDASAQAGIAVSTEDGFMKVGAMASTTQEMVLTSGSSLTASVLASGAVLQGTFTTTAQVTGLLNDENVIGAGSVLDSGSIIGAGTTLQGNFEIAQNTATVIKSSLGAGTELKGGADTLLKTGTVFKGDVSESLSGATSGNVVVSGGNTYIKGNTAIKTTGLILTGEATLAAGSILESGSILTAGSTTGHNYTIQQDVTLTADMALKGSGSTLDIGSVLKSGTTFATDALEGSGAIFGGSVNLKAGSSIGANSILANGSSLGLATTTGEDEKVAVDKDMLLTKGSIIAKDSTITAGTVLTNDILASDGTTYAKGTTLEYDIITGTAATNKLTEDMVINGGSILKSGTTLAVNDVASDSTVDSFMSDASAYRLSDVDVTTQEGAQIGIAVADAALKSLDKVRSDLGSVQNQLTSTIANISTTKVNVEAAESSIRDVDFAEESANFTKMQILSQAGTFAMSQANASSQNVLSLLQ